MHLYTVYILYYMHLYTVVVYIEYIYKEADKLMTQGRLLINILYIVYAGICCLDI